MEDSNDTIKTNLREERDTNGVLPKEMRENFQAKAEKYTSKWDNIDIDEILNSDRLLENYKKCLMNEGKCTPEGTELKKRLPDALTTDCSKCTEKQKKNTEKVVNCLIETKKEWWNELQQKYDPTGIYYNRYLQKKKSKEQKSNENKGI